MIDALDGRRAERQENEDREARAERDAQNTALVGRMRELLVLLRKCASPSRARQLNQPPCSRSMTSRGAMSMLRNAQASADVKGEEGTLANGVSLFVTPRDA